jgi:hypothetical protein
MTIVPDTARGKRRRLDKSDHIAIMRRHCGAPYLVSANSPRVIAPQIYEARDFPLSRGLAGLE